MSTDASPAARPQAAFDALKAWILDGSLSPGQRLPVRDLARGLDVSTMPVREALVRLRDAGLVTHEQHKSAVVSRLTIQGLNDYYDLRRILEPPSLQMGTERITPERLSRVHSTMSALKSAVSTNDLVAVLNLDEELLGLIHDAVGNQEITRVIRSTWQRIRPYKLLFTTTAQADAGTVIVEENSRLLEAAESRDGVAAHDMMLTSLYNARLRLTDLLRSHDDNTSAEGPRFHLVRGEELTSKIAQLRAKQQPQIAVETDLAKN